METPLGSRSNRATVRTIGWVIITIVATAIFTGPSRSFDWRLSTYGNPAALEGMRWWSGSLSLPHRLWDTAKDPKTGAIYNVFPPLLSLIGLVATVPISGLPGTKDFPEYHVLPWLVMGILPAVMAFLVFRRRTGSSPWATVLAIALICGTPLAPCMELARQDSVYQQNHVLSQIGLLLLCDGLLGSPRWLLTLAGFAISAWSRQLTILYAPVILWLAWREKQDDDSNSSSRMPWLVAGIATILAVPMILNAAKFGGPLSSGYLLVYQDQTTGIAEDARTHGLFSPHFFLRNAYYMNAATPWAVSPDGWPRWAPSPYGASIWLTTPLLLLAAASVKSWRGEPAAWALMICSLIVIALLLLYHNRGYIQYGYFRFALDFAPVWMVVAAKRLTTGRWRWATAAASAWSVAYFWAVVHYPATGG